MRRSSMRSARLPLRISRLIDGLRVRAAVHTGTADERDGDYFGPALNRVARLLAIGHGGQVLVSGVTTDLVQGALPSGKQLARSRRASAQGPCASRASLSTHRTRISRQTFRRCARCNSFRTTYRCSSARSSVAKTDERRSPRSCEQHRLVTLVGSGGVGKTRLSLQVAANLLDGFGDGVWFIELAPLTSGEYIPSTVALALGLTLAPEGDPVENLVRALKGKQTLLVFDNCEHLVEPAARVISAILHGSPKVKVLASSRQGLGVAGEATYRVPSLELPARMQRI